MSEAYLVKSIEQQNVIEKYLLQEWNISNLTHNATSGGTASKYMSLMTKSDFIAFGELYDVVLLDVDLSYTAKSTTTDTAANMGIQFYGYTGSSVRTYNLISDSVPSDKTTYSGFIKKSCKYYSDGQGFTTLNSTHINNYGSMTDFRLNSQYINVTYNGHIRIYGYKFLN